MRKFLIAGNWKMYKTKDDAVDFIYQINDKMPSINAVRTVICAPFTCLRALVKRQGDNLRIGAENMHFMDEGAFTGEISAVMLKSIQVTYVILGHSERRQYFNETDEDLNKKIKQALKYELIPILCVGESLSQREAGVTNQFIKSQLDADLLSLSADEVSRIVIAYEPIWAIGTGRTATSSQANETIKYIRDYIKGHFGESVAEDLTILYGGSVNTKNAQELLSEREIDGALIGGASLNPNTFLELVKIATNIVKQ